MEYRWYLIVQCIYTIKDIKHYKDELIYIDLSFDLIFGGYFFPVGQIFLLILLIKSFTNDNPLKNNILSKPPYLKLKEKLYNSNHPSLSSQKRELKKMNFHNYTSRSISNQKLLVSIKWRLQLVFLEWRRSYVYPNTMKNLEHNSLFHILHKYFLFLIRFNVALPWRAAHNSSGFCVFTAIRSSWEKLKS